MRIVTGMIAVVTLVGAAAPATAQTQPRPTPLPRTCTDDVATPGALSCTDWLAGTATYDVEDAIVKALASFAVDKGGGFILSEAGLAALVDPNAARFEALKAQLAEISQQITVLQTSTDNVFTALKQLNLDTKLQYLRDLVINIKTLFNDYYLPIVDAVGPVVAARRTDPSCTETACQAAQKDLERLRKSFLDQFEGGGGVNLAATNTKIHESLLPSDPGQSVLSAYGDVLMTQNRFLSELQSNALRQLYTTFANWEALATWMKAEWTAATRPGRLQTLIEQEIVGYGKSETAALPPKIPAGTVIDLGPNKATRTGTRNVPMWLAAGSSLTWRPGVPSPPPNDVASVIAGLNKAPDGFTDWKPPTRAQMDVLLATATKPAPVATTLAAISPGSAAWGQTVNGSSNFWTSDKAQTAKPVTCSFYFSRTSTHARKLKYFFNLGPYAVSTAYSTSPATNAPTHGPLPQIWPLSVPNPQEINPPASAQGAPCEAYVTPFFNRATGTLLSTRQTADSAKEDYMAVSARPKQTQRKAAPPLGPTESTTTVSSSKNPAPFGEPVTFTARVEGPDGGRATGQVQFAVDGIVVGAPVPVQGGTATSAPLADLPGGTHRVEARYEGGYELAFSSGVLEGNQEIDRVATALTLAADPPNPSYEGDPVAFRVSAVAQGPTAGGGAPTGTIELLEGDRKVGEGALEAGRATITIPDLRDGTHQLLASYAGDDSFDDARSAPVQQRVINLRKLSVTPSQVGALGQGDTVQLTATGTFSDNTTADVTADVKWSSSNPGVATVSRTGLVTVALDAPKTTITIVATLAQQKDTTSIAVGLPGPSAPPAPPDTTATSSSAPAQEPSSLTMGRHGAKNGSRH